MSPDADAVLRDAIAHHAAGRVAAAAAGYRAVLAADPGQPLALHHLGLLTLATGDLAAAEPLLRRAAAVAPADPGPRFHLGQLHQRRGAVAEAEAAYRSAASLAPGMAVAHQALGDLLLSTGRPAEAVGPLRTLVGLAPQASGGWAMLGRALAATGQFAAAADAFGRAAALSPGSVAAHDGLARALDAGGRHADAVPHHRRLVALLAGDGRALNNLGQALVRTGHPGEGVDVLQRAAAADPASPAARVNLASGLRELHRPAEASAVARAAVALRPDDPRVGSAYLYGLHFDPAATPAFVAAEHRAWAGRHADPLPPVARPPRRQGGHGRLRVGYVSADLREHVVGRFVAPVVAAHDRGAFEVLCYSDTTVPDGLTARLRQSADAWRDTAGLDDAALAAAIAADGIDVLVDLTGHMANGRLLAFARRPAPAQVSHVGVPASPGVPAVGHRVTDRHLDPADPPVAERLLRLPDSFYLYDPPAVAVSTDREPGPVTFASLSAPNKSTPAAVDLWAAVLRRVPAARLLLAVPPDGSTRDPLARAFDRRGVDPARLDLVPTRPWVDYLRLYARADVVLDPQPYGGGITTCDALWCGVPVVALVGPTGVGRVAASVVRTAGWPAWAAGSADEYADVAAAVAAAPPARAAVRRQLLASPLCDAVTYTRHLERLYHAARRVEPPDVRPGLLLG